MLLRVLLEGVGLGAILMLVCAVGIRNGAVGMVHLYHADVQERCVALGLTTKGRIQKNALRFKAVCLPIYIAYVLVFVYAVNGARGFLAGFWQLFGILFVLNLMDRFFIDVWWVGHKAEVALRHPRHGGDRRHPRRDHGPDPPLNTALYLHEVNHNAL